MSFWKSLIKKNLRDIANVFTNYDLTKEPSGFVNNEDIIVTYDEVARTITLEGDLRCLYQGEIIQDFLANELSPGVYSWTSAAHPEGIVSTRFLKYNGGGFDWGTTPWKFYEVQIAYVCYCASTGVLFAQREVHGLMNGEAHARFHSAIGTTRESGGEVSNIVVDSTVDTNRRPNISACTVLDEDLTSVISAFTYGVGAGENKYSHLYLTGAGTIVLGNDQDELSFLNGGHPTYNQWDGTEWLRTQLPNARAMSIWVLAIPTTADEFSKKFRFVMVQGQSLSTSVAAERTKTPMDLNLTGLTGVLPEFTFIQQIILQRTGIGAGNWVIKETVSLKGSRVFFVGAIGGGSSGLEAGQVTYDNETSLLTAEDVQAAIDELVVDIDDNTAHSTTTGSNPHQTPSSIVIACSDEETDLTVGLAKVTFRMPYAFTLTAVKASLTTVATGSVVTVGINEDGVSILSTDLTIDADEKTSATAATPAVISDTALAADAEITIDIDAVGSSTPGKGLKVTLIGRN